MGNGSKQPMRQSGRSGRRQRVRRGVQIVMLMFFPATFLYFSPVVSAMGASEGIATGSLLLFGLLFVSSVVIGRLFCAWVCPGGALGEIVSEARPRRLRRDRVHWIKYLVWAPWLATILLLFFNAGGVSGVEPLYSTEVGLSTTSLSHLIAYLMVVVVFLALMFAVGKRAPCHTICWIAPFMVLGRSVGNALRLPALRLAADSDACIHCGRCSAACPMGLEVQPMAERGVMDSTDCILCAECIDVCPKSVISYRWKRPGPSGAGAGSRAGAAPGAVAGAGVLALLMLFTPSDVGATPAPAAAHHLSVSMGWESTWVVSVGYAYRFDTPAPARLIARLIVPAFAEGALSGGRVETGIETTVPGGMGWGVTGTLLTGVGWSVDDLGSRVSWTADATMAGGHFANGWHVAAEAGLRSAILTWFLHAPVASGTFADRFPGDTGDAPGAGPFALTSLRARVGVQGGLDFDQWGVKLSGGLEQAHSAVPEVGVPPIFPLPFYAKLTGEIRW